MIFLIWDVLAHAFEPVANALGKLRDGSGGVGPVAGYAALFFLGITVGLGSLVLYEGWLGSRARAASLVRNFGPGAMAQDELTATRTGASPAGQRRGGCPC